ncbi:MYND Zn-finger protein [Ceratobasidium sp. AG-Ba]|nr:MYND Zn-finger protein [Ceratobasidium sp. AG-Ba]
MLVTESINQIISDLFGGDGKDAIAAGLGCDSSSGNALPSVGDFKYEDACFLVNLLWRDRFAFFTLCERRMLPGLSALLFALYGIMTLSEINEPAKPWSQLQELFLRAYLTATFQDQHILAWITINTSILMKDHGIQNATISDDTDARKLVDAYARSISTLEFSRGTISWYMLRTSTVLFYWIADMLRYNLLDLVPITVRTGLERLWREFDQDAEYHVYGDMGDHFRMYSTSVFRMMENVLRVLDAKHQGMLAKTMLDVDVYGLIGRILMMITREGP